jgi:hypothetical protein
MLVEALAAGDPNSTQFTVWASIVPCVATAAAMKSNSIAVSGCKTVLEFVLKEDIVSLLNQSFPLDLRLGPALVRLSGYKLAWNITGAKAPRDAERTLWSHAGICFIRGRAGRRSRRQ